MPKRCTFIPRKTISTDRHRANPRPKRCSDTQEGLGRRGRAVSLGYMPLWRLAATVTGPLPRSRPAPMGICTVQCRTWALLCLVCGPPVRFRGGAWMMPYLGLGGLMGVALHRTAEQGCRIWGGRGWDLQFFKKGPCWDLPGGPMVSSELSLQIGRAHV